MDNKKQQNEDPPKIINENRNAVGSPMNTGGKQGSENQLKESPAGNGEQNGDVQANDVSHVAGASRPSLRNPTISQTPTVSEKGQALNGNNDHSANMTHPDVD